MSASAGLPPGVTIRAWADGDFPVVQSLAAAEGWRTSIDRPVAALRAWQGSWPALVAVAEGNVIGFARALTDGAVTIYVADLLVVPAWRGRGIASALLDRTQALVPGSRLDLLATTASSAFYERQRFRRFAGFRKRWEERS